MGGREGGREGQTKKGNKERLNDKQNARSLMDDRLMEGGQMGGYITYHNTNHQIERKFHSPLW